MQVPESFTQKLKRRSEIKGLIGRHGMPAFWLTRFCIWPTDRDAATQYAKSQYKRDAAYILEVAKRLNEFPAASQIIMPQDVSAAQSILNCMDRKRAQEMKGQATKFLTQTHHFAMDEDSFLKFLRRFRNGPSERDEDDLERR
jgi:hypothetical protein